MSAHRRQFNTCVGCSPIRATARTGAVFRRRADVGALGLEADLVGNGCSTADPTGRLEGVVKARLAERANKLTSSSIGAGRNFDTTPYVLPR